MSVCSLCASEGRELKPASPMPWTRRSGRGASSHAISGNRVWKRPNAAQLRLRGRTTGATRRRPRPRRDAWADGSSLAPRPSRGGSSRIREAPSAEVHRCFSGSPRQGTFRVAVAPPRAEERSLSFSKRGDPRQLQAHRRGPPERAPGGPVPWPRDAPRCGAQLASGEEQDPKDPCRRQWLSGSKAGA